jgi:SAM-dependent methyltransferase
MLDDLPQAARVLDLGCGYGRLGAWVRERRPDIHLTGLDFTLGFCRHYLSVADAPAICGDAKRLPFPAGTFDAILAVTVLMYLEPDEVQSTFAEYICFGLVNKLHLSPFSANDKRVRFKLTRYLNLMIFNS